MLGKQKCKILKEIRQRIADENEIPYITKECRFQGECSGTCPRCESELRYLEQQLALRASMGKRVAVTALCAGMALSSAGCSSPQENTEPAVNDLSGAVSYYDDQQISGQEDNIEVTTGEVCWPESATEDYIGSDALPPETTASDPHEIELTGDVAYDWPDSGDASSN